MEGGWDFRRGAAEDVVELQFPQDDGEPQLPLLIDFPCQALDRLWAPQPLD